MPTQMLSNSFPRTHSPLPTSTLKTSLTSRLSHRRTPARTRPRAIMQKERPDPHNLSTAGLSMSPSLFISQQLPCFSTRRHRGHTETPQRHRGQVFHLADDAYAPPNTNSINSTSAGTQNERPDPTHSIKRKSCHPCRAFPCSTVNIPRRHQRETPGSGLSSCR